jgi:hypothetical protein
MSSFSRTFRANSVGASMYIRSISSGRVCGGFSCRVLHCWYDSSPRGPFSIVWEYSTSVSQFNIIGLFVDLWGISLFLEDIVEEFGGDGLGESGD